MLIILKVLGAIILLSIGALMTGTVIVFITAYFYRLIKRLFPEEFEEKDED